jgi:hypothetical protein
MVRSVIGSILNGAYGDLYEQAICLKHYAAHHPEVELKLFTATTTRLEAFRALDLSFATVFDLWTEIEKHPDISRFFQFQVLDGEFNRDILSKLPDSVVAKFDRSKNILPWNYMRDNNLIPAPSSYQLPLSEWGTRELSRISDASGISANIWNKPTINFLWRYRQKGLGSISDFGQKSQDELVQSYSAMFQRIINEYDCHILINGMNIVYKSEDDRKVTDSKYPEFGLELPAGRATYMKGLSWAVELEIASRATACCGHASGFTESLWLKRGGDMVLMDAPPHYLAKILYRRMPFFDLDRPSNFAAALLNRSVDAYRRKIESILKKSTRAF